MVITKWSSKKSYSYAKLSVSWRLCSVMAEHAMLPNKCSLYEPPSFYPRLPIIDLETSLSLSKLCMWWFPLRALHRKLHETQTRSLSIFRNVLLWNNHLQKSVALEAANFAATTPDKIRRRNSRLIFFRNHDIHGKSNASCFICISICFSPPRKTCQSNFTVVNWRQ